MSSCPFSRPLSCAVLALFSLVVSASAAPRWRAGPAVATNLVRGYAAQPLATDSLRPQERAFLERALSSSREEAQLARLALSQALDNEVRSLAQQLAADQRTIGDAVEALRRKKGAVVENAPPLPEALTEAQQRLAVKTGADFDREFVRALAEAHAAMITLFEQAAAEAKDTDVRDLAGEYLPVLRAHQNRLLALRKTLD